MYDIFGYSFVDDTYLFQNLRFGYDIIEDVVIEMQKSIYLWERVLKVSGVLLNPCYGF